MWNHKLKPFLQANIIEGIKLYGDKGNEWDDIITFIKNRYVFTSAHPKSPPIQLSLTTLTLLLSYPWTEDDLFDNLTAADVGLTRIETDPLLVMLKRLEAASKLTSDTESLIEDPFVPEAIY